jgi:hypothetical protein
MKTSQVIQFCLECDAVWSQDVKELRAERYSENGEEGTFMSLGPFLEAQGIRYGANAIQNVDVDNEDLWRSAPWDVVIDLNLTKQAITAAAYGSP